MNKLCINKLYIVIIKKINKIKSGNKTEQKTLPRLVFFYLIRNVSLWMHYGARRK